MGVRNLAALAAIQCIFFAACATASASTVCPGDLDVPDATTAPGAAAALLCDANALRAQNGIAPLRWNWRLWSAAEHMAVDMSARHFFSHVTPDGLTLADRVAPTGYLQPNDAWLLTENLAWGLGNLSTPLAIAYGWMNSPGHRLNLLDPEVEDVGIGVAPGPADMGGMLYVADFGRAAMPPAKKTAKTSTRSGYRFHLAAIGAGLRRPNLVATAISGGSVRVRGRGRRTRRG